MRSAKETESRRARTERDEIFIPARGSLRIADFDKSEPSEGAGCRLIRRRAHRATVATLVIN